MNTVTVAQGWNNNWEVRVNRQLVESFWRAKRAYELAYKLQEALELRGPIR